jgi:nucleoid DNA-binding protein
MLAPPRDQVVSVLADIVREALTRGEAVHVPGLGTFSVEHRSSQIEEQPDGQVVMKPPGDEIVFTPEP